MHLPIVWQWFPACRDFSVSLQESCKRRNQRQPRRCHTTAEDRLVRSAEPYSALRNTAKYRGDRRRCQAAKSGKQIERCCHRKLPERGEHGLQGRVSSMGALAADRRLKRGTMLSSHSIPTYFFAAPESNESKTDAERSRSLFPVHVQSEGPKQKNRRAA
jgi:hypothetical protein